MSEDSNIGGIAIGAAVAGAVGLAIAFIRALFVRSVSSGEKMLEKMQGDIASILVELRSMHDEQTRQRAEIVALGKDMATQATAIRAAHDRIDALVSVPPRSKR